MKFLRTVLIFLIVVVGSYTCHAAGTTSKPFVIHHFPRAAYRKERATFVLSGPKDSKLTVRMGEKLITTATFDDKALELNLKLDETGALLFSCGTVTRMFQIISPGTDAKLEVRDGFLGTKAAPAILLVAHRHPPKHDRTWETVKVLSALLGNDNRPKASSAAALGLDFLSVGVRSKLDAKFWKQTAVPDKAELNPMAGLILAAADVKPVDVLVIAPGLNDLELGTTPLLYRMHLEWLIQRVDRKKFPHVFLVLPPMSEGQRERFPEIREYLKLAALGNRAIFLERDTRQGESQAGWGKEIQQRMKKYLAIK